MNILCTFYISVSWVWYTFLGLLHVTLDPNLIMLSVKQGGIKYHFFESIVYQRLNLGLNHSLPDHWRTLYLLGQWPELSDNMTLNHTTGSNNFALDITR